MLRDVLQCKRCDGEGNGLYRTGRIGATVDQEFLCDACADTLVANGIMSSYERTGPMLDSAKAALEAILSMPENINRVDTRITMAREALKQMEDSQ